MENQNLTFTHQNYLSDIRFKIFVNLETQEIFRAVNTFKHLGYDEQTITLKLYNAIYHHHDRQRVTAYKNTYINLVKSNPALESIPCQLDFNLKSKEGPYRWVMCFVSIFTDHASGDLIALYDHLSFGTYNRKFLPRTMQINSTSLKSYEKELRFNSARIQFINPPFISAEEKYLFTETEFSILRLLSQKLSKPIIMDRLSIQKGSTYDTHKKNINRKINSELNGKRLFYYRLKSAEELAAFLRREGFFGKE